MSDNNFVDFLYTKAAGRFFLKLLQKAKLLTFACWLLRKRVSKPLIYYYIKKHNINMAEFKGIKYNSFNEFFSRKRDYTYVDENKENLISPCDGLLSFYPINEDSVFSVKGSYYRIADLIDDKRTGSRYYGGDCLVFRLCASDYHHYCFIDNGFQDENHFIEGTLHSVQPIAYETVPVYRLNRRTWTLLHTLNFGKVLQICIGALLVGGIINEKSCEVMVRGEEMGHFELAGSTIILLFQRDEMELDSDIRKTLNIEEHIRVRMGERIGYKKSLKK